MAARLPTKLIELGIFLCIALFAQSARKLDEAEGNRLALARNENAEDNGADVYEKATAGWDGSWPFSYAQTQTNQIRAGPKGEPLIPELQVPESGRYVFELKEKVGLFFDNNNYKIFLKEQCEVANDKSKLCFEKAEKDKKTLMTIEGGWLSDKLGHRLSEVKDADGKPLFDIRRKNYLWNPFYIREVFRVFPPGTHDVKKTLFTIYRRWTGKGWFWRKSQFEIYQGRKREKKQLYYAIGKTKLSLRPFKIFHSIEEMKKGDAACAQLRLVPKPKKKSLKAADALGVLAEDPDFYELTVNEKEDSAVLIVLGIVVDMLKGFVPQKSR